MVESTSIVSGPLRSLGPAPAAHNRASSSRETASSWRTLDHLKQRSHVPTVDGARVGPSAWPVAPARSTAVSSMESPPTSIDPITVNALMPLFAPCRASCTRRSTRPARPICWASAMAGSNPACGTRFGSSKLTDARVRS